MIFLFFFILIPTLSFSAEELDSTPVDISYTQLSRDHEHHIYTRIAAETTTSFGKHMGGDVTIGYLFKYFSFDARLRFANTIYDSISVRATYNDLQSTAGFDSAIVESSEYRRTRSKTDPWSIFSYEPGVTITGQLFPYRLPSFSQKIRFGVGLGSYTDTKNKLIFSATTFHPEVGIQYHFGKKYQFGIEGTLSWVYGDIVNKEQPNFQMGRLPISYMNIGLGFVYWL